MDFANPHFAEPRWLWLAVLAPLLLVVLYRYSAWARQRQLAQLAAPEFLADLTRTHSPLRRSFKHALLVLAVAGLGLALARPQWGEKEETGESLGDDIVFLLDCSRSMLTTDVNPSRLQRSKMAIMDFVQRHGRGRVGLVAFAGQGFLQCPLTFDYGAFQEALMAVDDRTIPVLGTDVGRALDEAFLAMEKDDRRKIMVLVTDGEDLKEKPKDNAIRTAEALAKKGIIVFSVGVGTPAGGIIHFVNDLGQPQIVTDSKGEVVRSQLDEATLRGIAQATKGIYQPLGSLGEGLTNIRKAIETIDERPGSSPARKLGVDRYHYPVAAVLLLLVIESLVGTRRNLRVITP